MNKEQQIAEMAKDIIPLIASQISLSKTEYLLLENQEKYNGMGWNADFDKIAELLYNAGYRKTDDLTLRLDLGDRSAEEIEQIAKAFNGEIRKQTAKEILTALCEPMDVWTETEDLEKSEQRKIGGRLFVKKANERIKELAKKYGVEVEE